MRTLTECKMRIKIAISTHAEPKYINDGIAVDERSAILYWCTESMFKFELGKRTFRMKMHEETWAMQVDMPIASQKHTEGGGGGRKGEGKERRGVEN